MDYAAKIWNFTVSDNNDSLEIIHRKFCKFALGVSINAPNLVIYGKLGRTPLSIHRKTQKVKYWHRLIIGNDDLPVYLRVPAC